MFERFTKDARAVVVDATAEAQALDAPAVEAEHLLLAVAAREHAALERAGLDHDAVREALEAEARASLAAAGVEWDVAPRPSKGQLRFAASSKRALERALPAAVARGDPRLTADHVLLGILAAEVGTVPRALALAGVDRETLRESV